MTEPEELRDEAEELSAVTVPPAAAGSRLDVILSEELALSRSAVQRLLEDGAIRFPDGRIPGKKEKPAAGQILLCRLPRAVPSSVQPENIPLDVRFEDEDVIVVNKPKGMVVHPAPGHETGTLVAALLFHCGDSLSGIGGVTRPGIVHRIDRDTTGLVAVAKNDAAHLYLAAQLSDHSMYRVYDALVVGRPREEEGTVDAPIGRHPTDRKKMAVIRDGKNAREAVTHYRVTDTFAGFSRLRLRLETGRTHQIRVHMSYIGHPVLGDPVYGGDKTPFARRHAAVMEGQCLHAGTLRFRHPRTGEAVTVTAPPPPSFRRTEELLRGEA